MERSGTLSKTEFEQAFSEKTIKHAEFLFRDDHRHHLYVEYLEVVAVHQPNIFVMENVKGILTSKLGSRYALDYILEDLQDPWQALDNIRKADLKKPDRTYKYKIHSFVVAEQDPSKLGWSQFIINAEDYSIPQKRHRLILFGVREDIEVVPGTLQKAEKPVSVKEIIGNLPKLRSHISRKSDRTAEWGEAVRKGAIETLTPMIEDKKTRKAIKTALNNLADDCCVGGPYMQGSYLVRGSLGKWLSDSKIKGVLQHRARGHMTSDLLRYLFASARASVTGASPTLYDFPVGLLPNHKNTKKLKNGAGRKERGVIFEDRFRVQVADQPATTITSHISKDGHYYIHYDPTQCRSLTGREAARLQTFPDNYLFEGNRTEQYEQIGNAVPPFLAFQLADVVANVMNPTKKKNRKNGGRS